MKGQTKAIDRVPKIISYYFLCYNRGSIVTWYFFLLKDLVKGYIFGNIFIHFL